MLPAVFDFLNGPVRDLVTQIYDAVGYLGVALWVALESVIIPIPSELVLPFAGFLVGQGVALEPITGQPWNFWLTVWPAPSARPSARSSPTASGPGAGGRSSSVGVATSA